MNPLAVPSFIGSATMKKTAAGEKFTLPVWQR